ncbi:hypothetical protein MBELCI_3493 [Limimaricola cinnabarinus LL-001]|uniref:Uncharacterized protein n=1 Tax=Limimaricola cinnabarinus LL-001 TaxID=1337093 RepID=U2YPW4_9RHOB|nr:hypothetical protein MBELCI_3493 [Limimaricola cinnabarinus LL-001]
MIYATACGQGHALANDRFGSIQQQRVAGQSQCALVGLHDQPICHEQVSIAIARYAA